MEDAPVEQMLTGAKFAKLCNQSINIYFFQQPIGFSKKERRCLTRATGVHNLATSDYSGDQSVQGQSPAHSDATQGANVQSCEKCKICVQINLNCAKLCKIYNVVEMCNVVKIGKNMQSMQT